MLPLRPWPVEPAKVRRQGSHAWPSAAFSPDQPHAFTFSAENLAWAKATIDKYPKGKAGFRDHTVVVAGAGAVRRLAA